MRIRQVFFTLSLTLFSILALEAAAFLLALVLQLAFYEDWVPMEKRPPVGVLAKRLGFLYQDQTKKSDFVLSPFFGFKNAAGSIRSSFDVLDPKGEKRLLVGPEGFVKNNSDPADPELVPKDIPIIFISGGSPVVGWGVDKNEDTIPALLAARLARRCESSSATPHFRVVNAGVAGHNSYMELNYFSSELSWYKPVAWIQLSGINEAWVIGKPSGSFEIDYHRSWMNSPLADKILLSPWMPATQKLISLWLPLLFKKQTLTSLAPKFSAGLNPNWTERTSSHFLRNISVADGIARSLGVTHYFFFQPTQATDQRTAPKAELERRSVTVRESAWPIFQNWAQAFYGEVRMELASKYHQNSNWHDLSKIFDGDGHEIYSDPRHYLRYGNERIAAEMERNIWPGLRQKICR